LNISIVKIWYNELVIVLYYILKFKILLEVTSMPFWKSDVIGIISKICLTITTVVMGLFSGSICLLYGLMLLSSMPKLILGDIFRGLLYLLAGVLYIYHCIYTRKGFYLRSSEYISKAYLMFIIAYFSYCFAHLRVNINTLISAIFITTVFGIPLNKAKRAFILQNEPTELS
jgi:hypothetical protein